MKHCPSLALRVSLAVVVLALPQSALADGELRASAVVSSTAGYSSNPFSKSGSNLGSAYVQVNAVPEIKLIEEHSTFSLDATLNYEHYFRDYSDSTEYGVGFDYAGTVSSRLKTHASVKYESSILGAYDLLNTVVTPGQPQPPVTTGPDLALFGTSTRRRSLNFSGDAAYTLSERDSLNANAFYDVSRYGGLSQANFDTYGGGLGYSRLVSEHLHLGGQASVARYVYQGPQGNSQVYSLQATAADQFSSSWNITGALGISYSDRAIGGKSISPTGSLLLCRIGERTKLCASFDEAVLPTATTGTVTSRSVAANYSYTLSERSSVSLSGTYSHNGTAASPLAGITNVSGNSFVSVSAGYDRTLRERIHFVANALYRKIMGGASNHTVDFGASVGISVRLGG